MKKILAVFFGLLITATAAWAAQPLKYTVSWESTDSLSCHEAFDLVFDWSLVAEVTNFFENDGTLRAVRLLQKGDVEIYREGYPDNVLFGRTNNVQHADFEDGILGDVVVTGIAIKVNAPGYGHLYFDVGQIYLDADFNVTLLRGANHDERLGETDALCMYFQ